MNVSGFELSFDAPWLLALAVPAMLAVLLASRRGTLAAGSRPRRLALALRLAEIALLAVLLGGPSLSVRSDRTDMVILADRSDSVDRAQVDSGIAALAAQAKPGTLRGVIDFAVSPGPLRAWDAPMADGLSGDATDIAAALTAAADALGGRSDARVVLLSDGVSTDGDALSAAQTLAAMGIRVDALPVGRAFTGPEAEVTRLSLPEGALAGQRVSAGVTVHTSERMEGVLRIADGGTTVWQGSVTALPGENGFSVDLYASDAGLHTYRAEFLAESDTLPENNAAYACMQVSGAARILLVDGTGSESQRLSTLLRGAGYAVDVVSCAQVPDDLHALCDYSLIVLMNVNARDLPEGSAERLEAAVSEYGRSVLTTGGENTYIYGGMQETAFERFLPVTMSVAQEQSAEPAALMLVIDTTDSMTRGLDAGTPMDMARQGAAACVQSLHVNDHVGVITFADDAQVLVKMTSMSEKEDVIRAIGGIETADASRLTRFTDALRLACDELSAFDGAQKKHVLFITDGSPVDAGSGFESIVKEMHRSGITLSAIAVGRTVNVRKLLENLATLGGGRCYAVDSAYDLPQIMFTDTVLLQVEYTVTDAFLPVIGTRVFPIRDESAVDQLYGCIRTTAREDAEVALSTPDGFPVYARWTYGAGVAASFMSDLSGDWSHNWLVSDGGKQLVLDMLGALMPAVSGRGDVEVMLASGGSTGLLTVRGGPEEAQSLLAAVTSPDGSLQSVLMQRGEDGSYTGTVALCGAGGYAAALTWQDALGEALDARDAAFPHSWSAEYEVLAGPDGRAAITAICAAAGGVLSEEAEALAQPDAAGTVREADVVLPLSMLVFACLMAELILRKRSRG